jgi:hypothetical protein
MPFEFVCLASLGCARRKLLGSLCLVFGMIRKAKNSKSFVYFTAAIG